MQPLTDPVQTSEAAKILGVSEGRVRQLERTGRLRALKTAKGVRLFERADVEHLAKQRKRERQGLGRDAPTEAHDEDVPR